MKTYEQFLNENDYDPKRTTRATTFEDSKKLLAWLLQSAELKKLLGTKPISSIQKKSEMEIDHGMGREYYVQEFSVNGNLNLEVRGWTYDANLARTQGIPKEEQNDIRITKI